MLCWSGGAPPRGERSKRADMTGQRGPRQAVARPASTIAIAPATAAARQGAPAMITRPGPAMTISCTAPPEGAPVVVEPPSGPASALARAAARIAEVCRLDSTAAAVPAPSMASRTPTARLTTDLVAITAARQASAASASALASGTSPCPVTAMSWAGSGRGAVKTACAQAWRAASTTSPAPAAPVSSTSTNSRRPAVTWAVTGAVAWAVIESLLFQQHVRVEAGPVAGVAGRADLIHLDHQGIAVAVQRHRLDPLVVPGGVALDPV